MRSLRGPPPILHMKLSLLVMTATLKSEKINLMQDEKKKHTIKLHYRMKDPEFLEIYPYFTRISLYLYKDEHIMVFEVTLDWYIASQIGYYRS